MAYSLLKALRDERQLTISLTSLGLTPKQSIDILADPVVGQGQIEDDMGEGLVDASDRIEGGDVITYWNDIEKDKRYHNWPIHPQGVSNSFLLRYMLKGYVVHAPCIPWSVP